MSWLAEIQLRWERMAGKKRRLDAADLAAVAAKAEADLADAIAQRDSAKAEFQGAYIELHAAGDEVEIRRHRKAIEVASRRVVELSESVEQCRQALAEAQRREEQERLAVAWRDADGQGAAIVEEAAQLNVAMDQLCAQARSLHDKWVALNQSLPARPRSDWDVMWQEALLARHVEMHLCAKSDGMLCRKVGLSAWEIMRGPSFESRVRESLALAFSARPKEIQPEPPRAA